jgi:class 3 adenylate cyclase
MLDEIEEFLTGTRPGRASDRVLATVVFTQIIGSRERVAETSPRRWQDLLDRHRVAVAQQLERFHGHEIKTAGEGTLATFDGPARAVFCAQAIRDAADQLGLDLRAGVHIGEVDARGHETAGLTIRIAAQVAGLAAPSEVLVSRTVVDVVVGSGIETVDRGEHFLGGAPGRWRLFAVLH